MWLVQGTMCSSFRSGYNGYNRNANFFKCFLLELHFSIHINPSSRFQNMLLDGRMRHSIRLHISLFQGMTIPHNMTNKLNKLRIVL